MREDLAAAARPASVLIDREAVVVGDIDAVRTFTCTRAGRTADGREQWRLLAGGRRWTVSAMTALADQPRLGPAPGRRRHDLPARVSGVDEETGEVSGPAAEVEALLAGGPMLDDVGGWRPPRRPHARRHQGRRLGRGPAAAGSPATPPTALVTDLPGGRRARWRSRRARRGRDRLPGSTSSRARGRRSRRSGSRPARWPC